MASKRQIKATGKWQYTVKRAGVLPKPLYLTFDSEEQGDAYCQRLESLLDRGIVPSEHVASAKVLTIQALVREYERNAHPSQKDQGALNVVIKQQGTYPLDGLNAAWVDAWISEMKRSEKLAPATIRARIGALARCADWGVRKGMLTIPDNCLRNLPIGYAQYTKSDEAVAKVKREDVERDRRLEPGEYDKILAVIEAGVLPRKQRPFVIEHIPAVVCLFKLALETAMRMREMYTLSLDQVDLAKRTIFLDKTKNGDKRQVPLSTVAVAALKVYLEQRVVPTGHKKDCLFPWWDGKFDRRGLVEVSDTISKLFGSTRSPGIFATAECHGLTFHDLRHEAVSRLFERTKLSETEIMKMVGHKSHRMLLRYTNLRGSNLADLLW